METITNQKFSRYGFHGSGKMWNKRRIIENRLLIPSKIHPIIGCCVSNSVFRFFHVKQMCFNWVWGANETPNSSSPLFGWFHPHTIGMGCVLDVFKPVLALGGSLALPTKGEGEGEGGISTPHVAKRMY